MRPPKSALPADGTVGPSPEQAALGDLIAAVHAHLQYLRSTGVDALPPGAAPAARFAGASVAPAAAPPAVAAAGSPATPPVAPVAAAAADRSMAPDGRGAQTLAELRGELGDCQRCKLAPGRTHLVFGVGNPRATLMFVGEGPGRDEDLKGEPFVGRAGQLLTEIITKGMKMRRDDVYIANVIKCRPPENRNPEADEINACQPFLRRQIEIIGPKVIVALGTFAAQTLLGVRTPISRLRGHWYDYQGVKLMPTLHPAYLLRNPADKKLVWADIKMVLAELGMPV